MDLYVLSLMHQMERRTPDGGQPPRRRTRGPRRSWRVWTWRRRPVAEPRPLPGVAASAPTVAASSATRGSVVVRARRA
jgi:hypothetical protein